MGSFLNPGIRKFKESLNSKIYIDKSLLIDKLNDMISTEQKAVCLSRPRRFGKSMAANMLAAYYGCGEDSSGIFNSLKIADCESYPRHLNQHDVIMINMQRFLSETSSVEELINELRETVTDEIIRTYPDAFYSRKNSFVQVFDDAYNYTNRTFIILIDEWDCIFREYENNPEAQKKYLDFLRMWLKDQVYVGLAYMTGILPIKKYGTHSALNMFLEFSVTEPGDLAPYFGFTEDETMELCREYEMNYEEMKAWYDGYTMTIKTEPLPVLIHVYSPKSVIESILRHSYGTYWNSTETYEALLKYIRMDFKGLKQDIVAMLAGEKIEINTLKFQNDMTTFSSKDDVMTLLIHLGYLTYDVVRKSAWIPNKEVSIEYINAIEETSWNEVINAVDASEKLLQSAWLCDGSAVARGVSRAHRELSILQYNDENALSYTISLAFYAARDYYTIIRELPSGEGFADLCFIPRRIHADKPAMILELKKDMSAGGAIEQIKNREYFDALRDYHGSLLLVGINYDSRTKEHSCKIEQLVLSQEKN